MQDLLESMAFGCRLGKWACLIGPGVPPLGTGFIGAHLGDLRLGRFSKLTFYSWPFVNRGSLWWTLVFVPFFLGDLISSLSY